MLVAILCYLLLNFGNSLADQAYHHAGPHLALKCLTLPEKVNCRCLLLTIGFHIGADAIKEDFTILTNISVFYSVYSLDDVLCLLVYVYSVAGQALLEQEDEESQLQVQTAVVT